MKKLNSVEDAYKQLLRIRNDYYNALLHMEYYDENVLMSIKLHMFEAVLDYLSKVELAEKVFNVDKESEVIL